METMRFKVTERWASSALDPRALRATVVVHNPYEALAAAMARVATPYWPCSDLVINDDAMRLHQVH